MSDQERIADLEAYERQQRPKQNGLDEGMCELARLIGLPDTPEGIREHYRREERRRRLRNISLLAVLLIVTAGLLLWLLT